MAQFFYSAAPLGVSVVAEDGEPLSAEEATAVAAWCALGQLERIGETLDEILRELQPGEPDE